MPYKRKTKRRRRRKRIPRALMSLNQNPVPQSKVVKLRYGFFGSINPGAGTTATWVVSANNLFDPDVTGTGHQPYGFDQWSTFYDHYVVLGSKITVTYTPTTGTAITGQSIASISLQDDFNVTASQTLSLLERPGIRYKAVGNSNSSKGTIISQTFSCKKFFGLADVKDNIAKIGASVLASPSEQAFYHINVGSIDEASNPDAVAITVVVDYIALFTERKELASS